MEYLTHFVQDKKQDWDQYVAYAMFVYNSSVHSATGFQPYELVYGYPIEVPHTLNKSPQKSYNYEDYTNELRQKMQDSFKLARDRLIDKKQKTKEQYHKKIHEITVKIGDKVLLKDHTHKGKLNPKWLGPFAITDIHDNENVSIKKGQKEIKVHKNELKVYNS